MHLDDVMAALDARLPGIDHLVLVDAYVGSAGAVRNSAVSDLS